MKPIFSLLACLFALTAAAQAPLNYDPSTNALQIDQQFVYAQGDCDVVYLIDVCVDDTLTNWMFATNIIGNGTNSQAEVIDVVATNGNKFYRINPE